MQGIFYIMLHEVDNISHDIYKIDCDLNGDDSRTLWLAQAWDWCQCVDIFLPTRDNTLSAVLYNAQTLGAQYAWQRPRLKGKSRERTCNNWPCKKPQVRTYVHTYQSRIQRNRKESSLVHTCASIAPTINNTWSNRGRPRNVHNKEMVQSSLQILFPREHQVRET